MRRTLLELETGRPRRLRAEPVDWFDTGIGPEALLQAAKFAEPIASAPDAVNISLY
jgi:hypothetical protein